jgi:hypothetical protein
MRVVLPKALMVERPGMPQLPVFSALIGVPPEGDVSCSVEELITSRTAGIRLSVTPPSFSSITDVFLPEHAVAVGQPAFFRDLRLVEVTFSPVRYNAVRREVETFDRAVVRVTFSGGERLGSSRTVHDDRERFLYEGLVLNTDQAIGWLRPRPTDRMKPVAVTPLASGTWVKIVVKDDGIYQIKGVDLEQIGVSLSSIPSRTLRMLYGGGKELPRDLQARRRATMGQILIWVEDGGDGAFDREDGLVFYGEAVARWEFDQISRTFVYRTNAYTKENVYWLTWGDGQEGLRMRIRDGGRLSVNPLSVTSARTRLHEELDQTVRTVEGTSWYDSWYWEVYYEAMSRLYSFLAPAPEKGHQVTVRVAIDGLTSGQHRLDVSLNARSIGVITFTGEGRMVFPFTVQSDLNDGLNRFGLRQLAKTAVALDWYEIEYVRQLTFNRGELRFTAPLLATIAEFVLGGLESQERVDLFEVSDPFTVSRISNVSRDDGAKTIRFQDTLSVVAPRQYIAVVPSRWKKPVRMAVVQKTDDLRAAGRGADYVVISHPDFAEAARDLAAWRGMDDRFGPPMKTAAVFTDDIYDQFAWGLFDPTAIRDFIKYAVDHWEPPPLFVTLLGDGSYDYKNNSGLSPGNWVPPYEEGESTFDEWYVRVRGNDDLPDLAIGRLSVRTPAEARVVVGKVVNYDRTPEPGVWHNTVLIVGDDERQSKPVIEPEFTMDAEELSLDYIPPVLNRVKVYLMEFEKEGQFKPAAEQKFIEQYNKGAVLLSYVGHGNPDVLAHEHVFQTRNVPRLENGMRLPFVFFAASAVGQFDKTSGESLPEALLKSPKGGAIGSIGGTRIGYHQSNMQLNRAFYGTRNRGNLFFSSTPHVPVGLALMRAKPAVPPGVYARGNTQRYSLFGDPATVLTLPEQRITLSEVRQLQALGEIRVTGQVMAQDGLPLDDFDGTAIVQVFDSATPVVRNIVRSTGDVALVSYLLPGVTIFRGLVPVQRGGFEVSFRVPKDISYGGRYGRISVFAWNDRTTGAGAIDPIRVEGTDTTFVADETGPTIDIGFLGQTFADGDFVDPSPVLVVTITDESGINIAGDVGHEIQLRLDDDPRKVVSLTDRFTSTNGYQSGTLTYRIEQLSEGEHTIEIRAWDNYNNSSYRTVRVRVAPQETFALSEVLCHPNPVSGMVTDFTYQLTQPATRVDIRIYTLAGRLVDRLTGEPHRGYNQVRWMLPDDLANGVYLYTISAKPENGETTEAIEKVVIMR